MPHDPDVPWVSWVVGTGTRFVDHSIITVIVENQTSLTVWVHPTSPNSTGLSLFFDAQPDFAPPMLQMLNICSAAGILATQMKLLFRRCK